MAFFPGSPPEARAPRLLGGQLWEEVVALTQVLPGGLIGSLDVEETLVRCS